MFESCSRSYQLDKSFFVKKKITKYEKWEILKDKEVKILEAAPGYVTLKQQYDDELDEALERDVFAVR